MKKQLFKKIRFFSFFSQVMVTIVAAGLFTALLLFFVGASPVAAFQHIFKGSLGSWIKFSHVVKMWVPLTLCACGLLYTFQVNLWNIGVEGQVIMGAVFTTAVLRMGVDFQPAWMVLVAAVLCGVIGGGIWAAAAGFLKTKGGVNEIFAGLGLNFVAQGLVLYLIFGPWKRPGTASMSGTEILPANLWLPVSVSWRISFPGLLLALFFLLLTFIILHYTRLGPALRAIGKNPVSAVFYGLRPGRTMLLAMMLAGGLSGIAGSIQVTGVYHRLIPAISSNYGYLALLVVMLANYRLWPTPFIAFFFACLNVGSIQLPMKLQLDSSLSGVIQGALVLTALSVQFWQARIRKVKGGPAES